MADFAVTELDSEIDFSNLPYWDVVIVGAGPAGLAAGLTTAHRGLTTLVVEAKNRPGGQPQFLYADKKIVDVPGFPDGVTGEELSARVFRQAEDALVQFRFNEELVAIEDTERVEKDDPLKRLVTNGGGYVCRKVIIACGLLHYPRKLPVLDQLSSKKVYYKIPKIGDYEENQVAVVGGGDSAMDAALMVLQRNGRVDMLIREEVPLGKADTLARIRRLGGKVHTSSEITAAEFRGDKIVLALSDGNNVECDLAIVQIGFPFRQGDVSAAGSAIESQRQYRHRSLLRDESPRDLRRRRCPWRRQTHHRCLGRGHSGRHLCLQGDHQPLLAKREAIARPKDHHDR